MLQVLKAERCDIYTDVEGIYTSDPRIIPRARKISRITYEEMLEMASMGAKVLHTRSVEMAMRYRIPIQVLSSFEQVRGSDLPGTLVIEEGEQVEQQTISGITCSPDEAKVTLVTIADRPGIAAAIFGPLAQAAINVDMIAQSVSEDGQTTDLTFTVSRADLRKTCHILESVRSQIAYRQLLSADDIVKVSIIGIGMRSQVGIAQKMFHVLAQRGINIQAISTSEIKVSVLIAEEYMELAMRTLHSAYGLDQPDAQT